MDLPHSETQNIFARNHDIVGLFDDAVRIHLSASGKKVFLEKSANHVVQIPFLLDHFPNAKILNIFRDGRDCFCSARSMPFVPQSRSIRRFAKYWKKCVNSSLDLSQDSRIHNIRYEDLVSTPDVVLSSVFGFLGLDSCGSLPDFSSTCLDLDARFSAPWFKKLKEPLDSASVGRFREELTADEIKRFGSIAGKELGYL
jgi:hypothetical protein